MLRQTSNRHPVFITGVVGIVMYMLVLFNTVIAFGSTKA
jgi:hypothetical protein